MRRDRHSGRGMRDGVRPVNCRTEVAVKVTILGAGVIGVTSAYQLARAGCEVTVIERQGAPALETSFANAGEVSFGYCSPWAAPGIPMKALRWIFMKHAPLILRPRFDGTMFAWLARMLSNCTSDRYGLNKSRMLRLADYSRRTLAELRLETGICYDERMRGTLQLFRSERQVHASAKDVAALAADGIPYEVLDRDGCVRIEPALSHVREKFVGGLLTPKDETGDCFKFTTALAQKARALGVRFIFGTAVRSLMVDGGKICGVVTDTARVPAGVVLIALGSYSPILLKPLGISLPIYPVKGYSLTIPIMKFDRAPESTVMDETFKIAITRLGDRIRVGGMAEISGYTHDLGLPRRRTLEHSVNDLFPGGDLSKASFWSGLRPMTPDGTPIIGPTKIKGLFVNTGHGTLGWTMSTGSARLISDLMMGRRPEVDARDFNIARYA